jgi:hypothetical protein
MQSTGWAGSTALAMAAAVMVAGACGDTSSDTANNGSTGGDGGTSGAGTGAAPAGGGSQCPDGSEACPCYGNSTCDGTLTCVSGVCVDLGSIGGTGGGAAGGSGGASGSGGTSGSSGSAGETPVGGAGGMAGSAGAPCDGQHYAGEAVPVDLLLMMDRSVSMGDGIDYQLPGGGTRHAAVAGGLYAFVDADESAGLGIGIDFYGQWIDVDNCDPVTYSTPEVEIAPLPGVGPAILSAYSAWQPGGTTPTRPAFEGAILHAQAWKAAHPDHAVYVVFITDGTPNGCGDGLNDTRQVGDDLGAIAAAAAADPASPVGTFMVGILGQEVPEADFRYLVTTVAGGGGTTPVVVEATDDLAVDFTAALDAIRIEATPPCSVQIPEPAPGETPDYGQVNVVLTLSGEDPERLPQVAPPCETEAGWYYSYGPDPEVPVRIELCPSTCTLVHSGDVTRLDVELGCRTLTLTP